MFRELAVSEQRVLGRLGAGLRTGRHRGRSVWATIGPRLFLRIKTIGRCKLQRMEVRRSLHVGHSVPNASWRALRLPPLAYLSPAGYEFEEPAKTAILNRSRIGNRRAGLKPVAEGVESADPGKTSAAYANRLIPVIERDAERRARVLHGAEGRR